MNRAEWQRIADERSRDAQVLITAGQWSGAYYLAGYAVECGLKSCVLRRVAGTPELIFLDRRYSEKCWTHDLDDLIDLADLAADRALAVAADVALRTNWQTVKDWTELDRYRIKTELQARALVAAVTDLPTGVLPWIKVRW
jgi:HEPN domain-containing protein